MIISRAFYFRKLQENRENKMHANKTIEKKFTRQEILQIREKKMHEKLKIENSRKYDAREYIVSLKVQPLYPLTIAELWVNTSLAELWSMMI